MMMRPTWFNRAGLVLLAGMVAILGCGPAGLKGRAVVKGTVSYNGKNLTAGTVTLASMDDGKTGSGQIDSTGNYTVTDAPVGECKVLVTIPKVPMRPGSMKAPAGLDTSKMGGTQTIDPSKIVQIPQKYSNGETSPLRYTVKSGQQTHNIELTP